MPLCPSAPLPQIVQQVLHVPPQSFLRKGNSVQTGKCHEIRWQLDPGRHFGPSERATWNFANFDESTLNLVTGESGIFLSPYYMDQWKAWYGGSTFAFAYSKDAVGKQRAHEMTLVPR